MARTADPQITEAVYRAVPEALAEVGLASLSIEAVAKRAGVNKTTIYRRWGTIEQLLSDVLIAMADAHVPMPNTGTFAGDVTSLAYSVRDATGSGPGRALLGTLWASVGDKMHVVAQRWWAGRIAVMEEIMVVARQRGDLSTEASAERFLERLTGPIHIRSNLIRSPMLDDELDDLVHSLVGG